MKSKYVNEANVKSSHAANTITMWLGIIGFIFFGFMLMAVLLYGDEDIFMISIIVLALIILSIVIAIRSIHYKKSLDNVYMYARYFEGDLDGYIYISDMTNVIGKRPDEIEKELNDLILRRFLINLFIREYNGRKQIVLESMIAKCQCKNCGAIIDKRVYFAGVCPYCKSSDIHAELIERKEK